MKNRIFILITIIFLELFFSKSFLNPHPNQIQAEEYQSKLARVEGIGSYFEIRNSNYLNIALKSNEEINIILESLPSVINLDIVPTKASFALLILEGLEPNKTYYKYQDSYKNGVSFVSDENGNYVWQQDLTQFHHIWFQEEKRTIFLPEDCSKYGNWDEASKTCTLNNDLTEGVEIRVDNITVDCQQHKISTSYKEYGFLIENKKNITIKNCTIIDSAYGVHIANSSKIKLLSNIISKNIGFGINVAYSLENEIINNTINQNGWDGIRTIGAQDNLIKGNLITQNFLHGITIDKSALLPTEEMEISRNTIIENILSLNSGGIEISGCASNYIYHNNFKNNKESGITYQAYQNPSGFWDNGYPSGGNYWDDYTGLDQYGGTNQNIPGSDGIGDTPFLFPYLSRDRYPFMKENGWLASTNNSPSISKQNQFKSDGIIAIKEGDTTTEATIVFKATLNDPENDQIKLQIELKEFNQSFNEQDLIESDFIFSGDQATIIRYDLINGEYKWRARAVDSKGNKTDWQEYGEAGNVDFKVKLVPLYTQVISPYPSWLETDSWDDLIYARGDVENYNCGKTIAQCGCAITSSVMVLRYYKITNVQNNDVNPEAINDWLKNNKGYFKGNVNWLKIAEYSSYKIKLDTGKSGDYLNNYALLDEYLIKNQPVIAKVKAKGYLNHFLVIDNKLASTYNVKDPYWYNTKKLDELSINDPGKITDYNNTFYGLRLFYPADGSAMKAISLTLASPAEILLTDPWGQKLGKDPLSNTEYKEIPDGNYFEEIIDNPSSESTPIKKTTKVIYLTNPSTGHYNIEIIGTDSGHYLLDLLTYDQTGNSEEVILEGSTEAGSIQKFELNYFDQKTQEIELYRIVDIDIKPGDSHNSINLKSEGVTAVAVLTDKFFDTRDVLKESIIFAEAKPIRKNFEDVDGDGDLDLLLHFDNYSLKLHSFDTEAVLTAHLNDGTLIRGMDFVKIIKNK